MPRTHKQTDIPEQKQRHQALVVRYHATRPFITCGDCGEWRQQYGIKPYCRPCDAIHRRTGEPRQRSPNKPQERVHCWVCLGEVKQCRWRVKGQWQTVKTCSRACGAILRHLRHFRGRLLPCQGCGRTRIIRAKCLCASCYVLARLALNQAGVYGQCSSTLNRFAKVPGVLRT